MEKILNLIKGINKPYRDFPARIIISLCAAHYILSHTTEYGLFEVVLVNGYTISLIGSFIIALIIVYAVFKVTVMLDRRVPYAVNWRKRCVYQFVGGVLAVSVLASGLAMVLFLLIKEPQRIWRYFNQDFPIILAFIICLNAYYYSYYNIRVMKLLWSQLFLVMKRYRMQAAKEFVPADNGAEQLPKKIAFIVRMRHRSYLARHMDATSEQWLTSIRDSISALPKGEYFTINPTCIIHIDTIQKIEEISSRRYKITFKAPLNTFLTEEQAIVSQSNGKAFVKWIGDRELWS